MRIITKEEFLKLPDGTVYCKGGRWWWEQISVKSKSYDNDWRYLQLDQIPANDSGEWLSNQERMLKTGESMPIQITDVRDGCFDPSDLFLVYEAEDLKLIKEYI